MINEVSVSKEETCLQSRIILGGIYQVIVSKITGVRQNYRALGRDIAHQGGLKRYTNKKNQKPIFLT